MISAFDHPFLSGLLGDEEAASLLDVGAEIKAMLAFEIALAEEQASRGIIPREAGGAIANVLADFRPDLAALRAGTARDGVVVPELVRQMRQAVGEPYAAHVHFGATSQDVIDTALVLRVKAVLVVLERRLAVLGASLAELVARFGRRSVIGYTRMQPALPIAVADRIGGWRAPLDRHIDRLDAVRNALLVIQFGGAVGTLDRFDEHGAELRAGLAARLGLGDAPQWHAQRDGIVELANWLSQVTGSLGKFGQDIALMAASGSEIQLTGGGTSSAMAHKRNPVDAEVLVALARFNAVQVSGLHQSLVHESERSGAAWTLEWLILPPMLMATAASTRVAARLVQGIASIGQ